MSIGRSCRAVLVSVLAAGAGAAAPSAASAACPKGAQCGTLTVPLDHTGKTAGTLPLAYAKVPALGTRTGTLVLLSGGPGEAAVLLTSAIADLLAPLRDRYDIVTVDQRGTGDSGAVSCDVSRRDEVAGCAARLGDKRAFWNTPETAKDLEDLRIALGIDKLTLLGVSYGAKVASEYVRRYPASTAAVVLDSPAPVDGLDGYDQLRTLGAPRVLREVCFPGACHATVTDPDAALAAAAERLQRGSVRGPQVSKTGRVRSGRVSEATLYEALSSSDLSPTLRAGLPAAIASLAEGDAAPLLHLNAVQPSSDDDAGAINTARLLATSCIEARLPWAPDSAVASREDAVKAFVAERQAGFAPFSPETVLASSVTGLCENWPPTPKPEGVSYLGPDVPVLVLSGRADLRTPLEDARRTALQYPNAKVLAVPGVGHSVLTSDLSGCALTGLVAFLRGQTVAACSKTSGLAALQNLSAPYAPATIGALRPTQASGLPGRTFSAVRVTLTGIGYDLATSLLGGSARLPGLRGGSYRFSRSAIELHDVEWIRGVRVSGRLTSAAGAGTLTVSGPSAAPGTLTFSRTRVSGTLGGEPVSAGS
jgi:pimeloyl-ACP methyl ester carboxylesterase